MLRLVDEVRTWLGLICYNLEMLTHNQTVQEIRNQLRSFHKQKKKVRIYHGTATTTRKINFKKGEIIDISTLNRVLEINQKEKYLVAEPNVSMEKLFKESIKVGLIPPVVTESPSITIGGAIQGGAGESGSFKWGAFHEICSEYEIVLGNGDIVIASKIKNSELFWGIHCSYGTLGIITKIKLKLIPAKKFVHVIYYRTKNFSSTLKTIRKYAYEPIDFIESMMFSKKQGVVMVGKYADHKDLVIQKFTRAFDEWYYIHVKKIADKHEKYEELVPIKDYIFRHNRGVFWTGEYILKWLHIPFNRFTRFLFNPVLNYKAASRLIQDINLSSKYIVQDLCIPEKNVLPFLEFSDKKTKIYPIFLVPAFPSGHDDKLSPGFLKTDLFIDVCLYKMIKADYSKIYKLNVEIEDEIRRLGGRKWFYAHVYYSKKDFWDIYDKNWYEKLRQKCHAKEVFPDVYEKTHVPEYYKLPIKRALLNLIKSPFKVPVS